MEAQVELAWAAGFFDGEGCTYVVNPTRGGKYLRIQVTQKTPELLERWRRATGCSGQLYKVATREMWQLRVCRRADVLAVVARLWPYLGEVKRQQFLTKVGETLKPSDPDWVGIKQTHHNP